MLHRAPDWPDNEIVCGPILQPQRPVQQGIFSIPENLQKFMQNHSEVVFLGFGSAMGTWVAPEAATQVHAWHPLSFLIFICSLYKT
jgi:hypothetical protein